MHVIAAEARAHLSSSVVVVAVVIGTRREIELFRHYWRTHNFEGENGDFICGDAWQYGGYKSSTEHLGKFEISRCFEGQQR